MKFIGGIKEYLYLVTNDKESCKILKENIENSLTILWFTKLIPNKLIIDGKEYVFAKNDIVFLTEFHNVLPKKINGVRLLRFNRPFYCILDHDIEVGCKGILFFGASQLPFIQIPDQELEKFETLWKMFTIEMQSNDNLQIEMLQMMLKRYLILCTRIYKSQANYPNKNRDTDIIREYNFLVEKHFKTKHTVAEYANLLNKSPKTISNVFAILGTKSPLQYIQDRKMLEARRLLNYSSRQIKEIAYEIGFEDIQAFSRFFKKQEGISPSKFKEKNQSG
jgi:AraC-like DNA-binding protein